MKRKYIKLTTAGLMLMLALTGCGDKIPEMTDAQAQQIGEYAAITLLKYDANHRSRLVDIAVIEAHDEREKKLQEWNALMEQKKEQQGMKPVEDTPVVEMEGESVAEAAICFEDFYELPEGMTVAYKGYRICNSYSGDEAEEFLVLDAANGKKLLVLEFSIANQTGSEQSIDLFSEESMYRVTVNDTYSRNALTTMFINDMSTYIGTIAAENTADVVLIVEIEEAMAEDISSISINMKNELKAGTIQLQ